MAEIYWIETAGPGGVALMPCPCGGVRLEEDLRSLRREERVDVLVSLLETDEAWELELADEARLAEAEGMEFVSHPIPDHSVPEDEDAAGRLVRRLAGRVSSGKRVAVHCRAGIGRSATIAGCILAAAGVPLDRIFERLMEARGFPVPETDEQRAWLERFAAGVS